MNYHWRPYFAPQLFQKEKLYYMTQDPDMYMPGYSPPAYTYQSSLPSVLLYLIPLGLILSQGGAYFLARRLNLSMPKIIPLTMATHFKKWFIFAHKV